MFDAGRFTDHLARHVFGIEKRVRPTAERDRQAADKVCEKVRDEWEGDHRDVSLDAIHGNIHRLLLGHHERELVRFAFGELIGDVARRNEPRRDHGDAHIVIAHQLRSDREREQSRAEQSRARSSEQRDVDMGDGSHANIHECTHTHTGIGHSQMQRVM